MKTNAEIDTVETAEVYDVFVYLHVLLAASKAPVRAVQLAELLIRYGFGVDERSLSALLHRFRRRGWLSAHKGANGPQSAYFKATPAGEEAVRELQPLLFSLLKAISAETTHTRSE